MLRYACVKIPYGQSYCMTRFIRRWLCWASLLCVQNALKILFLFFAGARGTCIVPCYPSFLKRYFVWRKNRELLRFRLGTNFKTPILHCLKNTCCLTFVVKDDKMNKREGKVNGINCKKRFVHVLIIPSSVMPSKNF